MEITVKDQMGGTSTFEVAASDPIYGVKVQIRGAMFVPTHKQHLVFRGTELQNQRSLLFYGIKAKDSWTSC